MKRFRLLPSILMLVLCIGVLAVGIYAAAPMANNVTGTISVKSSGAEVTLESWIEGDDSTYQKYEKVRTAQTFSYSPLSIDYSNAQYLSDVPRQKLRIKITNHSGKELGAYFFDETSATEIPTQATHDNILREDEFTSTIGGVETTIVGIDLTSYAHIGVASTDSMVITDEATLSIYFTPEAWAEEDASFTFNYQLVIEEYKPNVTTSIIPTSSTTEGEATTASNFIKLSSTVDGSARTSITRSTGFSSMTGEDLIVVVPNNVAMLGYISFQGCSVLSAITLPNSLTELEADGMSCVFNSCSIVILEIPEKVTEICDRALSVGSTLRLVDIKGQVTFYAGDGNGQFWGCSNLSRLDFLENCTSISKNAFRSCPIEKVVIPQNITNIEYSPFLDCIYLKEIVIKQRTGDQTALSKSIADFFGSSYTYTWTDGTSEVTTFVSSTEKDMVYTRVG